MFCIFCRYRLTKKLLICFNEIMKIKDKKLVQKLIQSGFSEKEAMVYVSVLELKGAFPSHIAEYCGLRRSTVYNVLTTLSVRGLINEIEKKNKFFFQIEKPENILRFANNRLNQAEDSLNQIKDILPSIRNIYSTDDNLPKITYYSGEQGLFQIFNDMTAEQKPYEMLVFTNGAEFINILDENNKRFYANYMKDKEIHSITTRTIIPDTNADRQAKDIFYKDIDQKYWPVFRYLDKDKFPSASEVTIYGINKVAIVNFKKGRETGVIIEDQAIHDMMKTIFELSWDSRRLKE